MAALKEIKARIASVQNTLKITSAMKMVASAKLRRVQAAAQALAAYERGLSQIAAALTAAPETKITSPLLLPHDKHEQATIVALSSDGSLCGSFNANAAKALAQQIDTLRADGFTRITVIPVGEKIAQAALKAGYDTDDRFCTLISKPAYETAAVLADLLIEKYIAGKTDKTILVYNHFTSMGHQTPRQETFLPMPTPVPAANPRFAYAPEYICEPEAATLLAALLPHTLRTRLYATLLDSATAEQAARTVAMQTATDNASALLDDLSLTYNKRRQQAITAELADIMHDD